MIYRPADDLPGRAAPGYLERIIEVCPELEFPPEYVAGLEAQRASQQPRSSTFRLRTGTERVKWRHRALVG